MDEALLIWTAAVESGFTIGGEWVSWADHQIARLDRPQTWIIDFCLVHSNNEALGILWPACGHVASDIWKRVDWTGLLLGFWYLRFKRGDMGLMELLLQSGRKADVNSSFRIDCSAFYSLASEIDGHSPIVPTKRPLAERVAELFEPLAESATRAWTELTGDAN